MAYVQLNLGATGETVRANVRLLRRARGLSQAQLAERIAEKARDPRGLTRGPKIQAIEAGFRRADADDLTALAEGLDVPVEKLLAPWVCETCDGQPAPRFTCRDCGTEGA